MFLYEVMTTNEIEREFELPAGSVRRDISRGLFRKSEMRKSGTTWLITKREALRVYKGEMTEVKATVELHTISKYIEEIDDLEVAETLENLMDDFIRDWAVGHVEEELKNELLMEDVEEVMRKLNIPLWLIIDEYHNGVREGITEDKNYIPFSQWFYEYYDVLDDDDDDIEKVLKLEEEEREKEWDKMMKEHEKELREKGYI